jgi:hypothetical protein
MSYTSNIAAAEALESGRIVANVSGNGMAYVDNTTVGPVYITTNSCAAGEYPELASPGELVLVTTGGSVGQGLIGATTDGVSVNVTPTGAAAAHTAGYVNTTDIGIKARVTYQYQYHGADA